MSESNEALGVDLGTTNCAVARVECDGSVIILPNPDGQDITPSVVYFDTTRDVIVGSEAKEILAIDPDNGVALVKRLMGTDAPIVVRGESHTPESISALILKQLVGAAAATINPGIVVTVPAYFGTKEREATYQAAAIAELNVLSLLDEPVAAAIHYGLNEGKDQTILVYDLGGGTFDTTVLSVKRGNVTVLATDGHNALGGADIDARLVEVVLTRMESGLLPEEYEAFLDDPRTMGQLAMDVENVKRSLSLRASQEMMIRTPHDRITITVSRNDLEEACRDLFEQTSIIIDRVLDAARIKGAGGIDEVIMVGGSSRIPTLTDRLRSRFNVEPKLVEPDLAVAKGAARYAAQLQRGPQAGAIARPVRPGLPALSKVTPVAPRAVGILIDDSFDEAGTRQFVEHFVHANDSLPRQKTSKGFGTIVEGQESVRIQVFEQAGAVISSDIAHNTRVLDGELTGLDGLPAGSVIEITIKVAIDGRLTVTAREPISGTSLTLEAFVEGVVDTEETEDLARIVRGLSVRG